jgi:DNA polymerase-3 subunit beta
MQFRISKDIFVKALAKLQPICTVKSTMPILAHVLIEVRDGQMNLTATDLEVGVRSIYEAEVTTAGSITVSAKKIHEIVKELPNEEIYFSKKENDWAEIVCGKARFNIVGMSADEFPHFQTGKGEQFSLGSDLLNDMIAKTSYAICTDETKYNLNGAFMQIIDDHIEMVTTDGHRLGCCKKPITGMNSDALTKGVILPKKGVLELKKLAEENAGGEIKISFEDNNVVVYTATTTMVIRLIDGEFPNYKTVLPVNNTVVVAMDRGKFISALKRMGVLSSEKAKGVKLDVQKDKVGMSARTPELGECTEDVEAVYDGEDMSINLNPKYLMEFAAVVPDNSVELKLKDALSPIIMKPMNGEDCLAIIMPMRLN